MSGFIPTPSMSDLSRLQTQIDNLTAALELQAKLNREIHARLDEHILNISARLDKIEAQAKQDRFMAALF